tara:strand:+ start:121 stop:396 length:276 start_codon:yes stop_codon:yes gene_type:complete
MPYSDTIRDDQSIERCFCADVNSDELVWHRDRRNREVKILNGTDWFLQFDNQMPIELVVGKTYSIMKDSYHRLMKGENATELKIQITENND